MEIQFIINIISALIFFSLGFILGIIFGVFGKNINFRVKGNEKTFITIIVVLVWLISFLSDMFLSGYNTPGMIHTIMGLVVGYFFDINFLNKGK